MLPLPFTEPSHCVALERGGGLKGRRATRRTLASLEWQYIVDDLSELSEVEQDGRHRADLRVQPIETFGETSPTA